MIGSNFEIDFESNFITGWVKYPDALHRLTYTTCNLKNAGREARNSRHTPELCSGWVSEFQAFLLILIDLNLRNLPIRECEQSRNRVF